jgi:hypothetical protein
VFGYHSLKIMPKTKSSPTKFVNFSLKSMASLSNHSRSKLDASRSEIEVLPGPFLAIFLISRNKESLMTSSRRSSAAGEKAGWLIVIDQGTSIGQ